jgi:voltage-gated potassium channel
MKNLSFLIPKKEHYDRFIETFFGFLFGLFKIKMPSKNELYFIIFQSNTPAGKRFEIYLLYAIIVSVFIPILNSIPSLHDRLDVPFAILEWFLTLSFTAEYMLRIYCSRKPLLYIISFFGIIDALSIFPFYLNVLFPRMESVATIRVLRMFRVFRVLNMGKFLIEASGLLLSIKKSIHKIVIFMMFVFMTSIILGAIMYSIEGSINPDISSIPKGIYWAIVTLTTVGYGDITPVTDIGQIVSGIIMILGYSVIAVPTGIISAEMIRATKKEKGKNKTCPFCDLEDNDSDAIFCKRCGSRIEK